MYYTNLTRLKVQKASEKVLALFKDHWKLSRWPIQAIHMTIGPFETRQKILESFWTSKKSWWLEKHFPFREPIIPRAFEKAVYYSSLTGLKVQKAPEMSLALLRDHLKLPLRPIQTTQMITGPFLTRQKKLKVFWTSNTNLVTLNHFFKVPINSLSL